jgi:hypothetical protein
MKRFNDNAIGDIQIIISAVFVLLVLASIGFGLYMETHHSIVYEKVTKTERVANKDGNGARYLVWGVNDTLGSKETFEITDSAVNWRWNSSDLYGEINVGTTYKFDVVGYRWGYGSSYRNIITATEISAPTEQDRIKTQSFSVKGQGTVKGIF